MTARILLLSLLLTLSPCLNADAGVLGSVTVRRDRTPSGSHGHRKKKSKHRTKRHRSDPKKKTRSKKTRSKRKKGSKHHETRHGKAKKGKTAKSGSKDGARRFQLRPSPLGRLVQAASLLPDVSHFPKGTDHVVISALVRLDDKHVVLLDHLTLERRDGRWVWTGVHGTTGHGAARVKELRRAGVRPHAGDPDKWLSGIYRKIRKKKWNEVLLESTWLRDPKAHSLKDDILADRKACGKKRYHDILKHKLPRFGPIDAKVWFVLVEYQITGKSGAQVELGLVPIDEGWRIAHLRVLHTKSR